MVKRRMVVKQSIWRPNKAYGSQQPEACCSGQTKRTVVKNGNRRSAALDPEHMRRCAAKTQRVSEGRNITAVKDARDRNVLAERPKGRRGTAVVLCRPKRPRDLGPWAQGERSGQRERGQTQGKQTHTHEPVPCLTPSLGVKPLLGSNPC